MLGLGACLVLRARGDDTWAAIALAAALLHTPQPRGLQGAALPRRRRVRARGGVGRDRPPRRPAAQAPLDRRRVPRRLARDRRAAAVQRLRLRVGDAAGAAAPARPGHLGRRARRRARARGARRDGCARRALLRQGDRPRAARPAAQRGGRGGDRAPVPDARRGRARSPSRASCSAWLRACCSARSSRSRRGPPRFRPRSACTCPAPARCRRSGSRSRSRRSRARSSLLRGRRAAAPAPTWACGQLVEPALGWTSAGFTQAAAARARRRPAPRAHDRGAQRPRASSRRSPTAAACRSISRNSCSRRPCGVALWGAAQARRLQTGHLGTYVGYLIALVLVLLVAAKAGLVG